MLQGLRSRHSSLCRWISKSSCLTVVATAVAGEVDVATIGAGMGGTTEVGVTGAGVAMTGTAVVPETGHVVEVVVAVVATAIARVDADGKVSGLHLGVTAGTAGEVIRLTEAATLMVEVTGDMGAEARVVVMGGRAATAMNLILVVLSSLGNVFI